MTVTRFEELMAMVSAGTPLPADELSQLAATPDILPLGMLADTVRRRMHGAQVTYLRVATCEYDKSFSDAVPPAAREIRITGRPDDLDVAVASVESAKAVAGERTVAGWSWEDLSRLASGAGVPISRALQALRAAGLDALADVPLDREGGIADAVEQLAAAGYRQVRLGIAAAAAAERTRLLIGAAALQERFACIQAVNPLPTAPGANRPSTGYEDVKMVAIARLAAPNIPTVQVDWRRHGPKLAQVALTFGADDLDCVAASDESPDGRRRAPLEEVRRNIEAAGLAPAERDGFFGLVS